MSTYTFQDFYTIFKKRSKIFSLIFIILILGSLLANNTFLKNKLSQKYTIIFDYDFSYPYINYDKQSVLYDEIIRQYRNNYSPIGLNGGTLKFVTLKKLHESYWELIYKFNLSDTKNTSDDNLNYEISKSFKFDNQNYSYRNRKLRMSWHNIEEAKNYIENLSERAINEIKEILIISHRIDNGNIQDVFKNRMLPLTTESITKNLKFKHKLQTDLELDKYVNKNVEYFFNRDLSDRELIMFILKGGFGGVGYKESKTPEELNTFNVNDENYVLYYLDKKYNLPSYTKLKKLDFFPEITNLIKNIRDYIPKYQLEINKINIYHFYLIQIILSLLIPFLIICTLDYKKLKKTKIQRGS